MLIDINVLQKCSESFFFNLISIPWLLPILDVEDVAKDIVHAVRTNTEEIILPKALGKLHCTKRYLNFFVFDRYHIIELIINDQIRQVGSFSAAMEQGMGDFTFRIMLPLHIKFKKI